VDVVKDDMKRMHLSVNDKVQAQKRAKDSRTQIHSCVNSRSRHSTALYKFARIMFGYVKKTPNSHFCGNH
jgi:hypothetical protein